MKKIMMLSKSLWLGLWGISGLSIAVLSYQLGKANSKIQVIEKQVEVVKYVEKERSEIQARPHATRLELLERMRAGIL